MASDETFVRPSSVYAEQMEDGEALEKEITERIQWTNQATNAHPGNSTLEEEAKAARSVGKKIKEDLVLLAAKKRKNAQTVDALCGEYGLNKEAMGKIKETLEEGYGGELLQKKAKTEWEEHVNYYEGYRDFIIMSKRGGAQVTEEDDAFAFPEVEDNSEDDESEKDNV